MQAVVQITRHTLLGSQLVEPLLRLVTLPFFKSPEQVRPRFIVSSVIARSWLHDEKAACAY